MEPTRRRLLRGLLAAPLALLAAGCKKSDKDFETIETEPVDIEELRRKKQQQRKSGQ